MTQELPNNSKDSDTSSDQSSQGTVSAPSISLPKGGGAIRGIGEKFAANPVNGTGSMSVPIATSPGRSGFGPQLSLSYDSGAGNGPFGLGWNLSIPSITRKTDKGLPKYQDAVGSDEFILSGAEDLVPVFQKDSLGNWLEDDDGKFVIDEDDRKIDGQLYRVKRYRPRTEGLFAHIERWTNTSEASDTFWRSISKDNITTWYGKTSESRIFDPENPDHIFSWLICESYDDKGNVIIYGYEKENSTKVDHSQANEKNRTEKSRSANRYLKRIRYGNHAPYFPELIETSPWPQPPGATASDASTDWFFEVVFDYGEHNIEAPMPNDNGDWDMRHDPFSTYRAGFEVRTYRLCQRVLIFHHFPHEAEVGANCLVRSTDFNYRYEQESDELDPRNPIHTVLTSVTQCGYRRQTANSYLKKTMPSVEFDYSQAVLGTEIKKVESDSLENLPYGVDGSLYQWLDLDGEGLSGVLTEQGGAWFYKSNESPITRSLVKDEVHYEAQLGAMQTVTSMPSAGLSGVSNRQFLDLAGDGQVDLVELDRPTAGFYERTEKQGWQTFRAFKNVPIVDWNNPNLKFIDLTGDGHADVLLTENQAFTWYPSLAEAGFAESERVSIPTDEERGPRVVFADGTQSIFQADLSGDGLTDIVRIRNGEVCYWPNLGYGRFAAKITMDDAPWFDSPDQFNPGRIRLADIDGSGVTDIIYLGRNKTQFWYNQSGNTWSAPQTLEGFPSVDNIASIAAVDLLGNGTACLVWSSPLPSESHAPMRYLEVMAEGKPHLMIATRNNLGAETRVHYAPSTYFYLKDKEAGKPWITKLPFPVHVVERVETYDHINRNRFVTRYAYHHGYFDGVEREFQGFAMVEQWDTERFDTLRKIGETHDATNLEKASHVPPVLTKTWFHTGAYIQGGKISIQLEQEYYHEGDQSLGEAGLTKEQLQAMLLNDTVLPANLSADETREACRALKGSVLRQEVYALDNTEEADRPYSVSESNFTIKLLQPREKNRHAVFFVHPHESIDFHYERKLIDIGGKKRADPRVSHNLTLAVDEFGNVLQSVAIAYQRRSFPGNDHPEQKQTHIVLTVNRFANRDDEKDWYRSGLPVEMRTYELVQPPKPNIIDNIVQLFSFEAVDSLIKGLFPSGQNDPSTTKLWPYEKWDWQTNNSNAPLSSETRLRLIENHRSLYRKDNLSSALPLGKIQSKALPYESYTLAFTPELISNVYKRTRDGAVENLISNSVSVLGATGADGGGYVDLDSNGYWWIPSEQVFYSQNSNDNAATELTNAELHFFLPHRFQDPIGNETVVAYDKALGAGGQVYDLFITLTKDAAGNEVRAEHDYRVMQPNIMIDPNHNHSEVTFDTLGLVAGTAIKGKVTQGLPESGDSLQGFKPDLTEAQLTAFMNTPKQTASSLLAKATTRIVYDLDRFRDSQRAHPDDPSKWQPVYAATLARETHTNDPLPADGLKVQIGFSYSDGFGREIQSKIQAEPEKTNSVPGPPRWVGSGWTLFNNKGKPVRQYEPFFSQLPPGQRHHFEFGVEVGVSPVLFYDPLERVIATLHPNKTYEKVVFDPWRQETWDVNDTVLVVDPKTDPDVGDFFRRLPETDYLPTWYGLRTDAAHAVTFTARYPEQRDRANEASAATKAASHAGTPAVTHVDSLGRTFLTVADNGQDANGNDRRYETRIEMDIEGNTRSVTDAKGRIVMQYDYNMAGPNEEEDEEDEAAGNLIHQASMEAGERWSLNDVGGNPIRTWDSRGHNFTMEYDALRRPVNQWVRGTDPSHSDPGTLNQDVLFEKTEYGEGQTGDTQLNLRTQVFRQYDGAGEVTNMGFNPVTNQNEAYDFKGNLLRSQRQLATDYKKTPDWSQSPPLENEIFSSSVRYDALNRPVQMIAPHSNRPGSKINVIRPGYNEANLLELIDVWLDESQEPNVLLAPQTANFHAIRDIGYDAKGQRMSITYGNSVTTKYGYDDETFRLIHLFTSRGATFTDDCPNPLSPPCGVQNLHYTYDPAGNIIHIRDDAQQTIFFKNKRVDPNAEYTYDPIYRLIEAKGREHLGQAADGSRLPPKPTSHTDSPRVGLLHPGDGLWVVISNSMSTMRWAIFWR